MGDIGCRVKDGLVQIRAIALVDNTSSSADLKTVHGLGIYIETRKHKLLFDLGPDDTCFVNAEKLGVDLAEVDTVVISHGHYDHGGALARFLDINGKANIYIRRQAFEPHFARAGGEDEFIGLDPELAKDVRIVFTDSAVEIDDELFVFSDIRQSLGTQSSLALFKGAPDEFVQDDFDHEQSLIVTTEGKAVLFSGCSHSGIPGILSAALRRQPYIDAVFGGFHLFNPNTGVYESDELIETLAGELSMETPVFYTCHCTGDNAFARMRETMGEKLQYFSVGSIVEL